MVKTSRRLQRARRRLLLNSQASSDQQVLEFDSRSLVAIATSHFFANPWGLALRPASAIWLSDSCVARERGDRRHSALFLIARGARSCSPSWSRDATNVEEDDP
jgi:hypothetical protein